MEKIKILLNKVEDIQKFVRITTSFSSDINVHKDSYIVDGKSILGLMSLDLTKPVEVMIITDEPINVNSFKAAMRQFQLGE